MSRDEATLLDIVRAGGYDIVDLDEVWKTANTDVSDLLARLKPLLPKQE